MKKIANLLITVLIITGCTIDKIEKNAILVTGTTNPVINLDGIWKFSMNPPADFYLNEVSTTGWNNIQVPGECAMQGFAIKHNTPYVYRTSFSVPEDYKEKIIKIIFEGVYSYARVWVNGVFIRDHSGGFTPWECEITDKVKPGSQASLTVEFTDKDNEISYASGYAKHQIGGILRSVRLVALAENYLRSVQIRTDFDKKYADADLIIKVNPSTREKTWMIFRLYDQKGKLVKITDKKFLLKGEPEEITFHVKNPDKWDAEHPVLYTLISEIFNNSILTASNEYKIGFREVEVNGNKILVNGQPVKLRGADRHDIHPLLGRTTTPEYDKMDVLLAREANINFIRTSHYPPSESFLKYCDEYGIYVEDESAVCFVNTNRRGYYRSLVQDGPEFTPQYLSQVEEMVSAHQNHPSIIIWSTGNENDFNEKFKLCYDYIKSVDTSRPVMFSNSDDVPEAVKCYDLFSYHYPSYTGSISRKGFSIKKFNYDKLPVLYDEWAHVVCYDKPELLVDENARNFWGQGLDSMWANVFDSDGGLGGAIWGMINETFMVPDTLSGYNKWWGIQEVNNGINMYEGPVVGYGEWGIVDTWRRKKPEFWNTKKAYSPIRIMINEITNYKAGSRVLIPVYNRFNHTNLKEVTTKWQYKGKIGVVRNHDIKPFNKGIVQLPQRDWEEGESVNIKFLRNDSSIIDEYNLRFGLKKVKLPACEPGNLKVSKLPGGKGQVEGKGFTCLLNNKTGLLEDLIINNDTLIKSGPFLHYIYPALNRGNVCPLSALTDKWKSTGFRYEIKDGYLNVYSKGNIGKLNIEYVIKIDENGTLLIDYSVKGIPEKSKVQEMGLKFITGNNFESLKWDRKSYWNSYPSLHLGMLEGNIRLTEKNDNKYRTKPNDIWEYDNKSYYYNGMEKSTDLSYMAGSMKENIYSYSLLTSKNSGINVYSQADKACRFAKTDNQYFLYIDRFWDYNGLQWGNYMKNQVLPQEFSDIVYLKID